MEIVIVASINPFVVKPGGTRNYVMHLINSLLTLNMNVTLIGISSNEVAVEQKYRFIPIVTGEKISNYRFLFSLLLKSTFLQIPKKCVIHTQRPDMMFPFVLFFRGSAKICTIHGLAHEKIFIKRGKIVGRIYNLLEDIALRDTDAIIAVSDETKESYLQKSPWLKDKITVIPPGFDDNKFRPLDKNELRGKYGFNIDDNIILYVGRFVKEKRIDVLLDAFKEIEAEIKSAKLVLVGDGVEKQKIETLIKKLRIKNTVLMDTMNHDQIPEIMNCADVFALTSSYEGMPTVVLEALACGIPVVSTNVGDVHKVVKNDITGYIVENPPNSNEIKNKIITVLLNKNKFENNCPSITHEYSWSCVSKKIIEIYSTCYK
jgi:L-malate glycosyltransferase